MTHPRQSTVSPILKPVSSPKRQASQRKPFALSFVSAQTSFHLRIHGISVPPGAPTCDPSCAPLTPSLPKVACNSQTGVTQHHEMMRTSNILRGNCMRNCRAAPVYARPETNEPRLQHIRIGNKHPDSLISYPDAHNLSGVKSCGVV